MTTTDIFYNKEARQKLKIGVDKLADAVKVTLGANGRNVIIKSPFPGFPPHITKDGVTVARNINLLDPVENMGATMLKNVASKVADICGDGTSSSCVLAQEIFNGGLAMIDSGVNPMEMKKGIDKAVAAIVEELKLKSIEVGDDNSMIKNVATISGNNDEAIGNLVAYVFSKIGKDGVVTIDESKTFETTSSFTDGMQIDKGYVSPYFVNDKKLTSELSSCVVFVTDKKISMMDTMVKLMSVAQQEGKNLLVVCENIEGEALQTFIKNCYDQKIMGCAVAIPNAGERRKDLLEDIAFYTGATVITESTGASLKTFTKRDFGHAEKVSVSRKDTNIINGGGDKEAINHRIADIQLQAKNETNSSIKDYLNTRAAKLKGGVAVISVGGMSDTEVKEKKDRMDDAVRATQSAIAEGISVGGGMALINAVDCLKNVKFENEHQEKGIALIAKSCEKPLRQIVENSGGISDEVYDLVKTNKGYFGYNAKTGVIEDLMLAGVIDPTKVVRVALENAASIAGMMLTSEAMIVNISEQEFAQ